MLDSQSHLHRQMRILSHIERRQRYRAWVQAFQVAMLLFFADQIFKTFLAGQLDEGEQRPFAGQSVLRLARLPSSTGLTALASKLPSGWRQAPQYLSMGFFLLVCGLLLLRLGSAKLGELLAFGLLLSGALSNLVSRTLTPRVFDTFVLDLGATRFVAFNLADLCVLVGTFFVLRGYLFRLRFGWLKLSRSSI